MTTATAAPLEQTNPADIRLRAMLSDLDTKMLPQRKTDKRMSAESAAANGAQSDTVATGKRITGSRKNTSTAKKAFDKIVKIKQDAYTYYKGVTVSWVSGIRMHDIEFNEELCKTMQDFCDQFAVAVDEFVPLYPDLINEARSDLNGAFDMNDYPPSRDIRSYFRMTFRPFVVSDPNDTNDVRAKLGDVATERIIEQQREVMVESLQAGRKEVYARIFKVVAHMAERLRLYNVTAQGVEGEFRDSTVENVRDLASVLPLLNLTNDPTLTRISEEIAEKLTRADPDMLRTSDAVREQTRKSAEKIVREVSAFV